MLDTPLAKSCKVEEREGILPLCFSFANIKIVNTSSAVNTASIKTPCGKLVPVLSVVRTLNGVGKSTLTR